MLGEQGVHHSNLSFLSLGSDSRFWYPGQPNSQGEQDCVELVQSASGEGLWNDESCTNEQTWICENWPIRENKTKKNNCLLEVYLTFWDILRLNCGFLNPNTLKKVSDLKLGQIERDGERGLLFSDTRSTDLTMASWKIQVWAESHPCTNDKYLK